jgi:tetratricopeptide (TPR) repeat protein
MMKPKSTNDGMSIFESTPFSNLVKDNGELAALRRDYASRPARERRMAADWEYHSQMASEIFNNSMALSGKDGLGKSFWPSGVVALAIDSLYAPAILTVGSIEYQLGRIEEAMKLFKRLAELPKDEEDLSNIIDKAGDFLIAQDDYENALALYTAAEKAYPHEAVYTLGAGYCLGKLGHYEESVEKHRRADALEPDNYKHLNDLGYSLLEAGKFDEAEEVLKRSISLAPAEYEFPHNNLSELRKKKKRKTATS